MIVADGLCAAAGVFTTNRFPGAPVIVSKEHLSRGTAQAIVCNSGCSNVATGEQGLRDAKRMCEVTAAAVGVKAKDVLVCSTGVIGHLLPMEKIEAGIPKVAAGLSSGAAVDQATAAAIMTTDLVPKSSLKKVKIGSSTVQVAGIAKGSGMIAPNMATMLSFITTDVAITPALLQKALRSVTVRTFNRIDIDHDTSTSDSVLVLASGKAGNATIKDAGEAYDAFEKALLHVCADLSYQIVKDGEGATRVYRVKVSGAKSEKDADKVGSTVVSSPLVKSAVHGGDPNWGRLIMAVGRSGAAFDTQKLRITIGRTCVFKDGGRVHLTAKQQVALDGSMQQVEVKFDIDLGVGEHAAEWLGCDLSREYVAINADYTT